MPGGTGSCGPQPGGGTCGAPGPATGATNAGVDVGAGNPVNVISGNKYQREVDMPPLPGVLGLELVRHYNSAYSRPTHPNGVVGRGWKLSYETELYPVGRTIQIVQADGSRVMFARDPGDPSLCSTAEPSQGTVRITRTASGDEYRWVWADGRILSFSAAGKLLQIAAPTGEFLTLQYDSKGLLLGVTDPQGRSLRLHYLSAELARAGGRFRGVQFIDTPVGQIAYEYGSALPKGASGSSSAVLANLVGVKGPDGQWRQRYHYEDPRHPTLLTGISVENRGPAANPVVRRIATYGYDDQGKGNLTVRGLPARLKTGVDGKPLQPASLVDGTGVEQVTLYTRTAGQTVVTNSLGKKTVYRHTILAGQYRLLEVRGAGCASCGDSDVRYRYDDAGRLLETIRRAPDGTSLAGMQTEYDDAGRIVRVSRIGYRHGKPFQSDWLERYEYVGDTRRPHLIARPSVVPGLEMQTRYQFNAHGQPLAITESGWAPATGAEAAPQALSRTTRYGYTLVNGRSLLTAIDGPLPNGPGTTPAAADITALEWDVRGNAVVAVTMPGNLRSQVRYDVAGRIAGVVGPDGHASTFAYNARHQIVAVDRGGVRQGFLYDGSGNLIESGDDAGNGYRPALRFDHDSAGRRTSVASHIGIAAARRFDTEGKLLAESVMSASFRQGRRFQYDAAGRLFAVTDDAGGTRRIDWNESGLPSAVTDALGRQRQFRYDERGQLSQVTEAANSTQARLYDTTLRLGRDALGRVARVTTPGGLATDHLTDDFGRLVATSNADRGTVTRRYDAADRLVQSTDANGSWASYEYDVAGHVVRQTLTDPRAPMGQRQSVTTWTYTGTLLTGIDHPSQQERYTHDTAGRMTTKTVTLSPAGGKAVTSLTEYAYDRSGRLSGISLPDGSMLEYRRNGQGQVVALERHRIRTSWLRGLQAPEVIVKDLERDIVGLRSASYGNGVHARYQRSAQGVLAKIDYRAPARTVPAAGMTLALSALTGAGPAAAAPARGVDASVPSTSALPGALGHRRDPDALLDHRYLWDLEGNLLLQEAADRTSTYAYDAQDHLIVSATARKENRTPLALNFSRYAYDGVGNRLLSQQDIGSQDELTATTRAARYAPGSQRWLGDTATAASVYDPTGQPIAAGTRNYRWDAAGQLREVHVGDKTLARYRYDHRGLRVSKETGGTRRHYLYEDRKLRAELSADGKIARQYVYLADQVVAVIDCENTVPADRPRSPFAQAVADLGTVVTGWFSRRDTTAYLHTNHLGAVEAATDREGKLLWQASYHPYGKLASLSAQQGFQLNLRLPGQYLDAETGLHYNDRRYYDPELGRYLTPDPIELQGGVNSYAYVDGNPLSYIDPSGLILFAFDGTGNSATPGANASLSNVRKIYQAYDEQLNGRKFYITGIGTTDIDMSYEGNVANGDGFDQRVALGFKFLDEFIDKDTKSDLIDIDVIGFSRGAAEARVWLNKLVAEMHNGRYTSGKSGKTRCLNLRFEGLFDTVSHLGYLNGDDAKYDFGIPAAVRHVAHAVALNEYRGAPVSFDLRSILGPQQPSRANRIEQAFVGAHSDVGGGYATGDLSDVALMWMLNQAKQQGIKIDENRVRQSGWDTVTLPILHDSSSNADQVPRLAPHFESRRIIYLGGTAKEVLEDTRIAGYSIADSKTLVRYYSGRCGPVGSPAVGMVDMAKYSEWTKKFGIAIAFQQPTQTRICQ
jgi:RHS repeat-associated protein